ncbi:Na+/H+ antiporter [Paenibacillus sp. UNC451MF]|uniref:Na+/H+ antiporter n=1 Tax=Paenibacillus sp. UNC451MF TaxID=1449063 RepID=UPI00048D01A0|nr:Na+/H+ antiporter [Paenibacillus sp. UNC451MF]
MDVFLAVLVLLVMIIVSNLLNRFVPLVPVPLIQIGLGMTAAILPLGLHLRLEPELFFILFIAPLLFNDGKMTPRDELWKLRVPILLLALGLVFVTVFIVGYFIHWMIPSIPLPAAFALAAILSPTDAVAVGSLAGRIHLPKKIMRLLEGEALMNDASGLVAFKFAIAAMVTGVFSLGHAVINFMLVAFGGLVCGAVVAFLIIRLRLFIRRWGMEDATFHMLLQILTPFVIYFIAEEFKVSGILAVVAAGIIHAIERDYMEFSTAKMKVVAASTWSVILFILNGLVFLILGLQIPDVIHVIYVDTAFSNWLVLGYIVAVSLMLIFLRFIWVYLFLKKTDFTSSLLTSLSGVRGAVTLAGAFSIPYMLLDGSPFPQRSLIIFIAAGVILFTLLTATFVLPLLTKRDEGGREESNQLQEHEAKVRLIKAAISSVKDEMTDENRAAAQSVITDYKKLMKLGDALSYNNSWLGRAYREMENEARMVGIGAEREELAQLLAMGEISKEAEYRAQQMLNEMELAITNRFRLRLPIPIVLMKQIWSKWVKNQKTNSGSCTEMLRLAKIRTSKAAIHAIQQQITEKNQAAADTVISHYQAIIDRLGRKPIQPHKVELFHKQKRELMFKAMQVERNEVQLLFEQGEISREIAGSLRKFINYMEATSLEEEPI